MKYRFLILVFILVGCSVQEGAGIDIEVTGNGSVDDTYSKAVKIGESLWSGDLKPSVIREIPELKDANLDEILGLQWKIRTYNDGRKMVILSCLFKSNYDKSIAGRVIDVCKEQIDKKLESYPN